MTHAWLACMACPSDDIDETFVGVVLGVFGAGRMFNNFPAVPIMRVVGDKGGMQIGYLLQVVSALMQASSTTVTSIAIAMWVWGAGLSFLSIGRQSCTWGCRDRVRERTHDATANTATARFTTIRYPSPAPSTPPWYRSAGGGE